MALKGTLDVALFLRAEFVVRVGQLEQQRQAANWTELDEGVPPAADLGPSAPGRPRMNRRMASGVQPPITAAAPRPSGPPRCSTVGLASR